MKWAKIPYVLVLLLIGCEKEKNKVFLRDV